MALEKKLLLALAAHLALLLFEALRHKKAIGRNAQACEALRALVLKRKISGPSRSRRGEEFVARGYSAHESCRRQGRDFPGWLHGAIVAWIDKTVPPSLWPVSAPAPTG